MIPPSTHLPLLALLVACSHGTIDSSQNVPVTEDEPYLLDDGSGDDVTLDAASLEAALAAAIGSARETTGGPALDAYAAAVVDATADCPAWYTDATGIPYWYDTCTTSGGASFSGYGYYLDYDGYDDGTQVWTGPAMYAAATVVTADGHTFKGSGSAYALVGQALDGETPYTVYYSVISGSFDWDGASSDGTWLSNEGTPALSAWVTDYGDAHGAYFNGSVPLDASSGYDAAVFDEATIANAAAGWACPGEIAGAVSVHSIDGAWYEVLFEGDDASTCDQCGAVWMDGVQLGQACAAANDWVDWDVSPW